jgi:polysaccharide deacetylase family protein (PEP-CTERM system associated)
MTARGQLAGADAPANAGKAGGSIVNAMTIDVEDYFQVSAFDAVVRREAWADFPSRVVANTEKILAIFSEHRVRATFFVLGWVAERFPSIVASIAAAGHELASHGFMHRLVYEQTPDAFRDDVRRAKALIEDQAGQAVRGYRAPSYSITRKSLWALDVLVEEGYAYDASIFRFGTTDTAFPTRRVIRTL